MTDGLLDGVPRDLLETVVRVDQGLVRKREVRDRHAFQHGIHRELLQRRERHRLLLETLLPQLSANGLLSLIPGRGTLVAGVRVHWASSRRFRLCGVRRTLRRRPLSRSHPDRYLFAHLGFIAHGGASEQASVQFRDARAFLGEVALHDHEVAVHHLQVAVLLRFLLAKRDNQSASLLQRLGIIRRGDGSRRVGLGGLGLIHGGWPETLRPAGRRASVAHRERGRGASPADSRRRLGRTREL
mmetsp:Transcript_14010/g.58990  ORF Transcript_14010/g.58990 Transcript_14010/m.58990 type:complete len:242 (-) Transcript_14010:170-895(-)